MVVLAHKDGNGHATPDLLALESKAMLELILEGTIQNAEELATLKELCAELLEKVNNLTPTKEGQYYE